MAISRAELLKELLPGLNQLFGMEYNDTPYDIQAKINKILETEKRLQEIRDGIQEQS